MASTTIEVHFKKTGESISVPVSLTSTTKDIIKYVCEKSVISAEIDYNNYYLVLLNNQAILDDDQTFEEIKALVIENPNFQLCMKTAIRAQIIMSRLAQQYATIDLTGRVVNPQIPDDTESRVKAENYENSLCSIPEAGVSNEPIAALCATQFSTERKPTPVALPSTSDLLKHKVISELPQSSVLPDIQSEILCGTSSLEDDKTKPFDTNLESNMCKLGPIASPCMQPTQGEVTFSEAKTVSSDDVPDSSLAEKLASGYRLVTTKINKIGATTTRDPVMRQRIFETFNEINIVLCGSPRVGKSTLINSICQKKLAKTSAGLGACTPRISRYFLKDTIEINSETINYQYNFWDTPGLENWTQEDVHRHLKMILEKPKSDILCMIYCASPGSYANLRQVEYLLKECANKQIFCALVCTNKWGGQKAQRDAVMEDFQRLLEKYHSKTQEENGVIYFGNLGLCTAVNSQRFLDEDAGKIFKRSGVDELILGIMQSLDDEKLTQWCMLVFENKPFWKNLFDFRKQFKTLWNKLFAS